MNDLKYTLTRKEFADHLGISRDTLKKRIKRGHYKDQYVIQIENIYSVGIRGTVLLKKLSPV
jgi:DNA-binding transcriptional regulator LsrR (DeoR family)